MTARGAAKDYLGGIGTMLAHSDICPGCGVKHESALVRYLNSHPQDGPSTGSAVRVAASDRRGLAGRRPVPATVPWPMPTIVEESL